MLQTLLLLAQDATNAVPDVVPVDPSMPVWLQALLGILSVLVTGALLPYLKRKAAAAEAEANAADVQAGEAAVNTQSIIIQRLKAFVYRTVADVMEREFMRIVEAAARGEFRSADAVKTELKRLHALVRDRAIAHFDGQGIDILKVAGDDLLDSFIESAANRFSPFPGSDTAKALLTEHVSDWLVDKGVNYVRDKWLTADVKTEARASAVVPTTPPVTEG